MKLKKPIIFIISIIMVTMLTLTLAACDDTQVGLSAYAIAVKNGFDGTEEEWLESLKGKDGEDGINGINGEDGEDRTITPAELYVEAKENGFTGTYLDFLKQYLSSSTSAGITYAINTAMQSAVTVVANFEYTYNSPFGGTETKTGSSSGSGVIYKLDKENGDCYIITNYHVVYFSQANTENHVSDQVYVFLYGLEYAQYKIPATYVGGSLNYDIAVLKVENSDILKAATVKSVTVTADEPSVGSTAIAIGNPSGGGLSATSGVISVDSENITMTGADEKTTVSFRVMRTDTAINSGNSGGGLFNDKGELIGIVNAKVSSSSIENIGYAIPVNVAVSVAENIMDTKVAGQDGVQKCMIGVSISSSESKAVFDEKTNTIKIKETVVVRQINEGSIGATLGLEVNDILLAISLNDGTELEIDRQYRVVDFMLNARVGDTVNIKYKRGETINTASAVINSTDVTIYA